jgi:hypothetical protein
MTVVDRPDKVISLPDLYMLDRRQQLCISVLGQSCEVVHLADPDGFSDEGQDLGDQLIDVP